MSSLIDQSLGKPIQGVSQQAESIRPLGQCSEQINFIADPVYGLRRRPATYKIFDLLDYDMYMDFMDKEGTRVLCVKKTPAQIDIYNVHSNSLDPVTITDTEAFDYIVSNIGQVKKPSVAYMESSLEDAEEEGVLYVSNSAVTVKKDETYVPPTRYTDVGIVYCLGGQYGREYSITVTYTDNTQVSGTFTTPNGSTASDIEQVASTYIMNELYTDLNTNAGANLSLDLFEDHLMITEGTKSIASITCNDDEGGLALKCIFNTVEEVAELPSFAPNGTTVTVEGSIGTEDDSYYRFFIENPIETGLDTFGEVGRWVETVKEGDEFEFDLTTMPVGIHYNDDGTFELKLVTWRGRELGDAESNKTPSIVNNTIQDLSTIQGRLALLSEFSVVFSRTYRPRELWRQTIIGGILDDDAVDGRGDVSTGAHTNFVKVQQDLTIFATNGQYTILGNTPITPSNINLSLTTRNSNIPTIRPVGVAGNIYFLTDNGDYIGVSEYYKEDINYFALPITEKVPRYIRGNPLELKGNTSQRLLAVQADTDTSEVFCYKFLFNASKRVQSAWFKLKFTADLVFYFFSGNKMYCVTEHDGAHILEELDFDRVDDEGTGFNIHLDRQITYTLDADGAFEPDTLHQDEDALFVSKTTVSAGLVIDYVELPDGRFKVLDGVEGDKVVGGFLYESIYVPTRPRVFDKAGEVISTGVLNVRDLYVNVEESGVFSWELNTNYGHSFSGDLSNRVWNRANNLIGGEPMYTRQWRLPWRGKSIDRSMTIKCNTYTPLNISYIEFVGDFRKTRTRV